ncbi:TEX9 protein, partial [Polypterus senegalus]|nr:TEX9 protein [Polypterus senegalus]
MLQKGRGFIVKERTLLPLLFLAAVAAAAASVRLVTSPERRYQLEKSIGSRTCQLESDVKSRVYIGVGEYRLLSNRDAVFEFFNAAAKHGGKKNKVCFAKGILDKIWVMYVGIFLVVGNSLSRKEKTEIYFIKVKKPLSARSEKPSDLNNRPLSAPVKKQPQTDLLAKEEEYKRLNAALEAKTAELVREAERVMKEQQEVLSRPVSSYLDDDVEDSSHNLGTPEIQNNEPPISKKVLNKADAKSKPPKQSRPRSGHQAKKPTSTPGITLADDVAVLEDLVDFSLAKTITNIEEKLGKGDGMDDPEDDVIPGACNEMGSESQIRFLKAKLRVMQEELDRLTNECNKKDDEISILSGKVKEMEEERSRLQRTTNIQQTQVEKYKSLAEENGKKSEGFQHQLSALQKELENHKRAQKQAATTHGATEVRLNRALEEVERYKSELNKVKQCSKDTANQEHHKVEQLKAENKKLEKQKAELMTGFKKQLKLIDILKRQKEHIEEYHQRMESVNLRHPSEEDAIPQNPAGNCFVDFVFLVSSSASYWRFTIRCPNSLSVSGSHSYTGHTS